MLIIQKSRRTPVGALAAAVLAVVAITAWIAGASSPASPPSGPTVAATGGTSPQPGAATPATGSPPVPADLLPAPPEDPARVFDIGFAGGLMVEPATVTALDRLQSMLGDNPTPEDVAKLERQLREGLPGEDADKAIKLFQGYRGYSQDLRNEVMNMGVPQTREAADALLARMNEVQHRHFDAASADAMFGDQNRLSKAVLLAAILQTDPGLTNTQKKAQLDALRASLPEAQRISIPEVPGEGASAAQ